VREGLQVEPKMPSHWNKMKVTRVFRGATFEIEIKRTDVSNMEVMVDGAKVAGKVIKNVKAGQTYKVGVVVPTKNEFVERKKEFPVREKVQRMQTV
jgi:cellobionic acid phosphorylase